MRVKLLMTSVFAVSMIGTPAAFAQSTTGSGADTTCSDFVSMDATAQADLIAQLGTTSGGGSSSMSSDSSMSTDSSTSTDSGSSMSSDSSTSTDSGSSMSSDSSSSSGSGSDDSMDAGPDSGSEAGSLGNGEAAAGGSMDSAAVLAACQNDPSLTVGEALSGGASGSM